MGETLTFTSAVLKLFKGTLLVMPIAVLVGVSGQSETHAAESAEKYTIVLPNYANRPDANHYVQDLVSRALATQGVGAEFDYYPLPTNTKRTLVLLGKDPEIDMTWLPATREYLDTINYIAIPLYQGLHGIRLLLINASNQDRFKNVDTLEALSELVGVQHKSWSDTRILMQNGLTVSGELDYDNMVRAIGSGFADYFPRSAMTIEFEQRKVADRNIIIEPQLALIYPSYYLLYVSDRQPKLFETLNAGFDEIIVSGAFAKIFEEYFSHRYENLDLDKRRKFQLRNSDIPSDVNQVLEKRILFPSLQIAANTQNQ
ncbi:substrate-binding periplasmic protein [Alteromonas facilis]|uniref:substrate-binding periplasmic protein n=1 Tax=Alteromonas facilis TaxID=2048004 RepID=UPI000C28AE95|nr:ABC transporter substrate-binding protein [Alteromonas facilis]